MGLAEREIIKPYYTTFIGVDTETTGVKPWLNGIVDIAAVVYNPDGTQREIFHSYCNPGDVVIEDGALKVNGLTREFIAQQEPIKSVLIKFVAFMDKHLQLSNPNAKSTIIGNNFGFDTWFFQYAFDKHIPELEKYTKWMFRRTIDLKGVVSTVMPNLKHISQDNLGKLLNIPNEHAHGALGDVRQMMNIYFHMLETNERRIVLDLKQSQLVGN